MEDRGKEEEEGNDEKVIQRARYSGARKRTRECQVWPLPFPTERSGVAYRRLGER
jgi:hypothetical protein